MYSGRAFLAIVLLGWTRIYVESVSIDLNCHQLYRFVPKTPAQIKYLIQLRNSNAGLIFWTPVNSVGSYTDILIPSELLYYVEKIREEGIDGDVYFNKISITMENVTNFDEDEERYCPTRVDPPPQKVDIVEDSTLKLTTNVYFTLSMRAKERSLVVVSPEPKTYGREIVLNTDPKEDYLEGGKFYDHTLWKLSVVPNEVGYFSLESKAFKSTGLATYITTAKGDKNLILSTDASKNAQYHLPGSADRSQFLWRVLSAPDSKYLRFKIKALPQGWVTWSEDPSPLGFKTEVDVHPAHISKYEENGEWETDAHWLLRPIEQVSTDIGVLISLPDESVDVTKETKTKDPLQVNTYYRISMKEFPHSVLTFDPNDNLAGGGSHVTLAVKNLEKYGPGGSRYKDTFWKVVASEADGYYTLENRNAPNAIFTYYESSLTSVEYIQLVGDSELVKEYVRGGRHRDRALVSVIQRPEEGYFSMRFASMNGYITWTSATATTSEFQYMHYDTKISTFESYQPGGTNDEQVLFSFTAVLDVPDDATTLPISVGTYYRISLKKFPNSILTYDEDESGIQFLGFAKTQLHKYSLGGTNYAETLWRLQASELQGPVVLENRDFPGGMVSYRVDHITGRKMITLTDDPVERNSLVQGGSNRLKALVYVRRAAEPGYFTLHFLGVTGFITWTSVNMGTKDLEFLMLDDDPAKFTAYNSSDGELHSNALFTLTPVTDVTDDISPLISGQYYQISMKKYPESVLSYTSKHSQSGTPFVQIVTSGLIDFEYGAKWFMDAVWKVTKSSMPGYYIIENKGQELQNVRTLLGLNSPVPSSGKKYIETITDRSTPNQFLIKVTRSEVVGYYTMQLKYEDAYILWDNQMAGHGYHIVADGDNPDSYKAGGRWREDVLFSFMPVPKVDEESGPIVPNTYYQLSVKAYPNSLVTYTAEHYLQITVRHLNTYVFGGWDFLDTAWRLSDAEDGHYVLENKGVSGGILRVVNGPDDTPLLKLEQSTDEISRGKPGRDSVLMKVFRTSDRDYFQIQFKSNPGYLAVSPTESSTGFLFQIVNKVEQWVDYEEGGKLHEQSLFSFDILPKIDENTGPIVPSNFYRLTVKDDMTIDGSVVSFEKVRIAAFGGRYIQSTTNNLDFYSKSGELYIDTLFQFLPTEVKGHYIVKNKGLPNAILTYESDTKVIGPAAETVPRKLFLTDNSADLQSFKVGGQFREATLVQVEKSEVAGFYTLKIRGMPNGLVSKQAEGSHSGWHLQVDSTNAQHYYPGGKWRDLALFTIEPAAPDTPQKKPADFEKDEPLHEPPPPVILANGYYRITLKRLQKSIVSYDEAVTSFGSRYVQVVGWDDAEFRTPAGANYLHTLWKLTRTLEFGGGYVIENVGLPHSLLTFWMRYATDNTEKYLILSTNPLNPNYFETGKPYRNRVIFNITSAPDSPGYSTIKLAAYPDMYITWKDEKTKNGYYAQIGGWTVSPDYDVSGRNRDDVLFGFQWVNVAFGDEFATSSNGIILEYPEGQKPVSPIIATSKPIVTSIKTVDAFIITTKPVDPIVITPKPVDAFIITDKPVDAVIITPKPVDAFIITDKPVDSIIITPKPVDAFIITDKQVDPVIITPKPIDAFIITAKPMDPVAITPKPEDPLIITDKPVDPIVITPKPMDAFIITSKPEDTVVITSKSVDAFLITAKPVDPNLTKPKPADGFVTTDGRSHRGGYIPKQTDALITNEEPTDPALVVPVDASQVESSVITKLDETTTIDLSTNTYYHISVKSKPGSRLAYTPEGYLQIVTLDLGEFSTPSGQYFKDTIWTWRPTELTGYYTLENANTPGKLVTYRRGFQVNYLVYGNSEVFQKGSMARNWALWSIKSTEQRGYYTMNIRDIPNGVVTWKPESTRNGLYMQVDEYPINAENFKPTGKWREDCLFSFIPVADSDFHDETVRNIATITEPSKESKPGKDDQFITELQVEGAPQLATGIIYTISLQLPEGLVRNVLTYSSEKTNFGGNYLQLVTTEQVLYSPQGVFYKDALWTLVPTEQTGYYALYQISQRGILTYTTSWGKRYAIIITDAGTKYLYETGGRYRDYALWLVQATEVPGYYTLSVAGLPGWLLSWREEATRSGYYMHFVDGTYYTASSDQRSSVLFHFQIASNEYKFHGKISYFKYDYPSEEIWNQRKRVVEQENITYQNPIESDFTVILRHKEDRYIENRFEYTFDQDMSILSDVHVIGGIDLACNPTAARRFPDEMVPQILPQLKVVLTNKYDYSTDIPIILPKKSSVNVESSYSVYALDMPFTALLEITSGVNRPTRNLSTAEVPVAGNIVLNLLKTSGIQGDIVSTRGNSLFLQVTGNVSTTFSTPITVVQTLTPIITGTENLDSSEEAFDKSLSIPDEILPVLVEDDDYELIERLDRWGLYSGMFYTITLRSIPGSAVTFTKNTTHDGGNYGLLANNPERMANYLPDGSMFKFAQWRFLASEIETHLEIRSRHSTGLLVVSDAGSTDGRFLELTRSKKHTTKYEHLGKNRDLGLWELDVSTEDPDYFQIRIKKYNESIVITDNKFNTNTGSYLQLDMLDGHSPTYTPNGIMYDSSLFSFIPANLQLHGRVMDFQYDPPADDIIKSRFMRNIALLSNISMHNPTSAKISFKLQVDTAKHSGDEFVYKFNQGFPFLTDTEFLTDLTVQSSSKISKRLNGGFDVGEPIRIFQEVDWSVTSSLPEIVVHPHKSVNVNYFYSFIENIVVPFKAVVEIKGVTDRLTKDGKIVKGGPLDSTDFIVKYVQSKGIQKVSGVEGNVVLVEVDGTLTATYTIPNKDFTVDRYEPKECDKLFPIESATTKPTVIPTTMRTTTTTTATTPKPLLMKKTTKAAAKKFAWTAI